MMIAAMIVSAALAQAAVREEEQACAVYKALQTRYVEQVRALSVEEAKKRALELRAGLDDARRRCESAAAKRKPLRSFATFRAKARSGGAR